MKRTAYQRIAVVMVLLLLSACTTQAPKVATTETDVPPGLTPAQAQIARFNRKAYAAFSEVVTELEGRTPASNDVPNSFNRKLRRIFTQAVQQQPVLEKQAYYLTEWSQLVSLKDIDQETPDLVGMFIFAQPLGQATDWVVRLVVNLDTWDVVSWDVNTNLSGGFKSANNYLPSLDEDVAYRRRINTRSNPYDLSGSELYIADVETSYRDTLLYGDDDKVYRIRDDYSLEEVGVW